MILTRAFYYSSYLLSLTGFLALVVAQAIPWWLAGVILCAYGLGVSTTLRATPLPIPRGTWTVLTGGFFVFYIVDVIYLADSILTASLHLLLYLLVQKLLTLQTAKDYLYLYAISFIQFLAAAGLTTDLSYGVAFLAYLLAGTWTMALYHLWCEMQARPATPDPVITGPFFLTTNIVAIGAFVMTVVFFFVIPRVGAGFFQRRVQENIRVTGFSEKVDLGAIGAIKSDPTIVMRVTLPDHPNGAAETLYWRGLAFDAFDGTSWQNTLQRRTSVNRGASGQFVIEATSGPLLRQEILLEPIETEVFFAADRPVIVDGRFIQLRRDEMDGLYLPAVPAMRVGYFVASRRPRLADEDRRVTKVSLPPEARALYLQLPRDLDPRITALAREAVAGAGTVAERVHAVQRWLQRNYRYSLEVESSRVEDFLLRTKTGYCEQYATAAILMLRTVGIPARMVSGFLGGEWNAFGGYYTVRQRDAHTWVEVYFPASGWMRFDPTPPGPADQMTALSGLTQALDALRLRWDRYIIRYSERDQFVVAMKVRYEADAVRAAILRWMKKIPRPAMPVLPSGLGRPLLLASGAAILAGLLLRLLRRPISARLSRDGAPAFYRRMLRLLQRYRLVRVPAQTPREFMNTVLTTRPDLVPVRDLTTLYEQVRFGGRPLTPEAARQADSLLARLTLTART